MKQLRQAREYNRLTQAELAEHLGTTQQTIARWESGKAEPNLAALRDLAICLHTTVDNLLGREPILEHQTTNPLSWLTGDKSGYWGNIGLHLPHSKFSTWYPITTSTMERLFGELQSVETATWISFQTLNNKMVICRPTTLHAFTFLDEAEDEVDGDWEVGPDEIEGLPQEIYECLEYLMWRGLGGGSEEEEFSDNLIACTEDIIKEYQLNEDRLMQMCVKTRITHTDGTSRLLYASSKQLADIMFYFDIGIDSTGSKMLHLDDNDGDHSVFVSLDLISRLEVPLIALKKGLEKQAAEDKIEMENAAT